MTKEASFVFAVTDSLADEPPIDVILEEVDGETFIVRARGFGSEASSVEREMGTHILDAARGSDVRTRVTPINPSRKLLVTKEGSGCIYSSRIPTAPRSSYQQRADQRPFKSPISLDPALARAMVNIAGVQEGDFVLDPFCGTGTILIEAGLVGSRAFGMEYSPDVAKGAKENLTAAGVPRPNLVRGDALRAPQTLKRRFDHMVTDPPYGRASFSSKRTEALLHEMPSMLADLLVEAGTACFALPSTIDLHAEIADTGLAVLEFVYQRVHGSLGRHLFLVAKP